MRLAFPLFQQQRTVYRLTLVKAWNVDELQAYAQLVSLGSPDFIEVKVSPWRPVLGTFHGALLATVESQSSETLREVLDVLCIHSEIFIKILALF